MPHNDETVDGRGDATGLPDRARRGGQARGPETGFQPPRRCTLYFGGHTVHHIQALRSADKPHTAGRLAGVEDNVISVAVGHEIRRFRNHEAERLLEIVGLGGEVRICADFSILRFDWKNGTNSCFSIAEVDEEWSECDTTPLTDTTAEGLAERIRTHGGFLVPGVSIKASGRD